MSGSYQGAYGSYTGSTSHGYGYSTLSSSLDSEHSDRRCAACNPAGQGRRDSVSSASRVRIDGLASPPPKTRGDDPHAGYASLPSGLILPRNQMHKPGDGVQAHHSVDASGKPQLPAQCHIKSSHAQHRPHQHDSSRRKGPTQRSSGDSRPTVRHSIDSARSKRSNRPPSVVTRERKPTYTSSRKTKRVFGFWGCFGG